GAEMGFGEAVEDDRLPDHGTEAPDHGEAPLEGDGRIAPALAEEVCLAERQVSPALEPREAELAADLDRIDCAAHAGRRIAARPSARRGPGVRPAADPRVRLARRQRQGLLSVPLAAL